jgi:hypothetical protein
MEVWYDRENQRKQIRETAPADGGSLFFPESHSAAGGTGADGHAVRDHLRAAAFEDAEEAAYPQADRGAAAASSGLWLSGGAAVGAVLLDDIQSARAGEVAGFAGTGIVRFHT